MTAFWVLFAINCLLLVGNIFLLRAVEKINIETKGLLSESKAWGNYTAKLLEENNQ